MIGRGRRDHWYGRQRRVTGPASVKERKRNGRAERPSGRFPFVPYYTHAHTRTRVGCRDSSPARQYTAVVKEFTARARKPCPKDATSSATQVPR